MLVATQTQTVAPTIDNSADIIGIPVKTFKECEIPVAREVLTKHLRISKQEYSIKKILRASRGWMYIKD